MACTSGIDECLVDKGCDFCPRSRLGFNWLRRVVHHQLPLSCRRDGAVAYLGIWEASGKWKAHSDYRRVSSDHWLRKLTLTLGILLWLKHTTWIPSHETTPVSRLSLVAPEIAADIAEFKCVALGRRCKGSLTMAAN